MSSSLEATAGDYLASSFLGNPSEKQILVRAGRTSVMPLINAVLARVAAAPQPSIIGGCIAYAYELISSIGQDAYDVLYRALQNMDNNVVLVSALILFENSTPSAKTIQAIAVARKPLWDKRNGAGTFDRKVDSTLWWLYSFLLYNSRSDPDFDRDFLQTLSQVGYSTPADGMLGLKQESYRVLLSNLPFR